MLQTIIGVVGKPLKIAEREDGTVEVIIKSKMPDTVKATLKQSGETNYIIRMRKKLSDKVQLDKDTTYRFRGYPKVMTTKSGVAVVYVACEEIAFVNEYGKILYSKTESKPKLVGWYSNEVIQKNKVLLDTSLIDIDYEEHKYSDLDIVKIRKRDLSNTIIAVRPKENGRYTLLVGFTNLLIGKLYYNQVNAFIYDGDREQFAEDYNIQLAYPTPKRKKYGKKWKSK